MFSSNDTPAEEFELVFTDPLALERISREKNTPAAPLPPDRPILLDMGTLAWGEEVTVTVERLDSPCPPAPLPAVYASAVFPGDLPLPLLIRQRQAGDAILSHGMTKKLKKLLNEKDIPTHLRDRLPVICLGDGTPLWYPSVAFKDGYPPPTEGPCIRITVRRKPPRGFQK